MIRTQMHSQIHHRPLVARSAPPARRGCRKTHSRACSLQRMPARVAAKSASLPPKAQRWRQLVNSNIRQEPMHSPRYSTCLYGVRRQQHLAPKVYASKWAAAHHCKSCERSKLAGGGTLTSFGRIHISHIPSWQASASPAAWHHPQVLRGPGARIAGSPATAARRIKRSHGPNVGIRRRVVGTFPPSPKSCPSPSSRYLRWRAFSSSLGRRAPRSRCTR